LKGIPLRFAKGTVFKTLQLKVPRFSTPNMTGNGTANATAPPKPGNVCKEKLTDFVNSIATVPEAEWPHKMKVQCKEIFEDSVAKVKVGDFVVEKTVSPFPAFYFTILCPYQF
jgi:hypothetical protein